MCTKGENLREEIFRSEGDEVVTVLDIQEEE